MKFLKSLIKYRWRCGTFKKFVYDMYENGVLDNKTNANRRSERNVYRKLDNMYSQHNRPSERKSQLIVEIYRRNVSVAD